MARPLRGGGLRKNNFFEALKKIPPQKKMWPLSSRVKARLMAGPLTGSVRFYKHVVSDQTKRFRNFVFL